MTLKFLYELLSHREGDIRLQAAALMGRIIANFNDTYTKELPEGVSLPAKAVTNLSLFTTYLDRIICPDIRFTEQHKLWIGYCLSTLYRPSCTAVPGPSVPAIRPSWGRIMNGAITVKKSISSS